ncbi:MAG TPA: ATP-binding protein [Candidatus Angelobacter sp.]|nr:ATP-binding protein [Candidatus Angelobacter sp.]
MAQLTRRFDWSKTPVGPINAWPDTLLTTVNLLLATRHPMFLWWGPELIQFYNDGYRPSIREDKHPKALGQRGTECWPEIWQIIGPQIEAVMSKGEATWHRNALVPIHRNGKLEDVYWTYSYSPVRDREGNILGTLVTCSETTEEVLGERRLRQSEARFRRLVEEANVGFVIGDLAGNLTYLNPTMVNLLGYSAEEVDAGLVRWSDLTPPEYVEVDARAVQELRQFGVAQPYEKAYIAKDGRKIPLLVGAAMLAETEGRSQEVAAFTADLSELKRAEGALRQTEKLAVVGRLASSIAHEINNPLEAVTNLLYLIASEDLPETLTKYVRMAQQELARVANITTQTLRFHRQSTNPKMASLSQILDGVLTLFHGRLRNADITVDKQFGNASPVMSYEGDLRQVFTNLLSNAIDATPPGGKIIVRERDVTDWRSGKRGVRVTIADTGHGMSAETRKMIFDPFFTTKGITGTGLGLWVSAEILNKHGATIRVRSSRKQPGQGTVFSILFRADGVAAREALADVAEKRSA